MTTVKKEVIDAETGRVVYVVYDDDGEEIGWACDRETAQEQIVRKHRAKKRLQR